MFNTFPGLLTYGFFAPTLLRLAAALIIASVAYLQWKHVSSIEHTSLPVVGKSSWWVWLSIFAHAAIAALLFFGYYTQIAAILGLLISIKHFIFQHRYPNVFPLSRSTYFLVAVICLSLMLSGAGALCGGGVTGASAVGCMRSAVPGCVAKRTCRDSSARTSSSLMMGPLLSTTKRSTKFCSWRTLPGQR